MGVADIARTSTFVRICLSFSLCSTPKRCSSSTTISPRSLNRTSPDSSRCVPMTTSTLPSRRPSSVAADLGVGLEARQRLHRHREVLVPLAERLHVLLHEQRRRDEHRHLLAVLHGLERRPDGDLGLPVADVAADQPVHRDRLLHVGLDLVDAGQLVGRLDVGEGVLELALPRGVGTERVPRRGHPRRVEPDELPRDLPDGLAGAALGLRPVGAAHPRELRRLAAHVAGDLVEGVAGDEQPVPGLAALAGRVLDHEVLAGRAADRALDHLDVPADTVLLVHDEVPGAQLQRVDDGAPAAGQAPHVLGRGPAAGDVGLGEQGDPQPLGDEPVLDAGGGDVDDGRLRRLVDGRGEPRRHVGGRQHLDHPLGRAGALGGGHHPPPGGDEVAQVGEGLLGLAAVAGHLAGTDRRRPRRRWSRRRPSGR